MASCAWCKRKVRQSPTGRPRLYCSAACKQHAYDERRLEAAAEAGKKRALDELRRQRRPFIA